MPNNKTLTILIVCLSLVVAVWLSQRNSTVIAKNDASTVSTYTKTPIQTNDDWKKILTSVDTKNEPVRNLTSTGEDTYEETTLTGQLAKDFLSQYLLAKKGGQALSGADKAGVAENIMSSPDYNKISSPIYVAGNVHVVPTTAISIKKYKESINSMLQIRSDQLYTGPGALSGTASKGDVSSALKRLGNMVSAGKGAISDMLGMDVPSSALSEHLNLLNSFSDVTTTLEGMGQVNTDPMRASLAMSNFTNSMLRVQSAVSSMNAYLAKN